MVEELLTNDSPREIRVFSRDEFKQITMQRRFPNLKYIIGDVRDREAIFKALRGVDIVYHAAALKQLPICEEYPMESIYTNILGTKNTVEACIQNHVRKAILISTDKAVKPVNVYGMCKAIAEKLFIASSNSATEFCCTRYGNVIGSRGSVIPLFKERIEKGLPLPITHPDMTRFLITLPQAIEIVMKATFDLGPGQIVTRRLPSCYIMDLARAMGGSDYQIVVIGKRTGEKIHECLISEEESERTQRVGKFYIINPKLNGTRYENDFGSEYTSDKTEMLDQGSIRELLGGTGWLIKRSDKLKH